MKQVPLSSGAVALIDDSDAEIVSTHKWYLVPTASGRQYARTRIGKRFVYMHRFLTGCPADLQVDHINGNGLDNRRTNLRIATRSQNGANRGKPANASGYKGVHWYKPYGRWRVGIKVQGQKISLGYFDDADEAARVYDRAARQYFGQFAFTNFPDDDTRPAHAER